MRQTPGGILDRGWRLVATGISFAVMGVGGLVLGLFAATVLRLAIRDREACARAARRLISLAFRGFVYFMSTVGVLRWSVEGLAHWQRDRACLVVANHPTLIDVVFLLALFEGADCVVKAPVLANPFWGMLVRTAGYVSNEDLGALLGETSARLQAGRTVILFPEGTRTVPGSSPVFGTMVALLAVRTGCPLLPVVITCTPSTLYKNLSWYRIPRRRVELRLRVCPAWSVERASGSSAEGRRVAQSLTRELEVFFRRELELEHAKLDTMGCDQEPAGVPS